MARRERLFEALGRLVAWERERERRSPKPHRARSAPSANQAPRIAPTNLCDQRSRFQPLRADIVEVIEVVGERGVHVGKREVRVCVDDLVRRHAEMLDLAGDLADLDVRAGDDGVFTQFVDSRPHRFHGLVEGSRCRRRVSMANDAVVLAAHVVVDAPDLEDGPCDPLLLIPNGAWSRAKQRRDLTKAQG